MTSEIKDPEIDAKSLSFLSNLMMMMLCFRVTHNFMSRTWNSEHVNFHMTLKSYLIITFWTYSSKKRHKARIKLARGLYTTKNIHSKWKIETYYILPMHFVVPRQKMSYKHILILHEIFGTNSIVLYVLWSMRISINFSKEKYYSIYKYYWFFHL